MIVWGITDGSAGMVAQIRALGVALELEVEQKTIALKNPWRFLPNICYAGILRRLILSFVVKNPEILAGAPDMIISCGRKGALVALGLKAKYPAIKAINIQDPQIHPRFFDLVIAMEHDKVSGKNVIKTKYALHAVTPFALAEARAKFTPQFEKYPSPRIAVLLGGSTNKYTLTCDSMELVIAALEKLVGEGASLLITPSRRTGEENIALLREHLGGNERVYIYDFVEENPYVGLLACADEITVTNDSVNMMSEAYSTGLPLHILRFCGHENTKPARFAKRLVESGSAQFLSDRVCRSDGGAKPHQPKNEMKQLAKEVKKRLKL